MNRSYIPAIIFSVAIILGVLFIGKAYNYKFKSRNTVNVLGGAKHNFTSDLIVWSGAYTRTSFELKDVYAALKSDEKQVNTYLKEHGIPDSAMIFSSIGIDKLYTYNYDENGRQTGTTFNGYQLRQTVKVESRDIEKVEKISREITELLQTGIEFNSTEPLYYYTKLADLKIDLLSKATEDARTRAGAIAENAKSSLGKLVKASMGVFQITGLHSNEDYTYGGTFNTSSKNKTASITVRLEYELD